LPKFSYIVRDTSGKTIKNIMEAYNKNAAVSQLQKQDYIVISVKELIVKGVADKTGKSKTGKRKFKHKKVKMEDMMSFARQLSTMLEAGVTLIRSLDVILTQIQSKKFFEVLTDIRKAVEKGDSLSVALLRHPDVFNQFWTSLVEVGEASGTIPVVLNKLTFYIEQQARFRSTIISGIIYPAILFGVSMGAVVFFALFVGPRFEAIFTQMGAELPLITKVLLAIFSVIKNQFFFLIGGIIIGVFLLKKYLKTHAGKMQFEKMMFNMPAFGETYKLIIVERFAAQMAILIDAGVPILYALDITERLVDNNTCALIVANIKDGVKGGELLIAPMERSEFFPPMCIQMIMVGEETGELSKMLKHVSGFYQAQVETFMNRFATIVEPFMLVFMGAVIGTIVLAMFLPMFNLSQM